MLLNVNVTRIEELDVSFIMSLIVVNRHCAEMTRLVGLSFVQQN